MRTDDEAEVVFQLGTPSPLSLQHWVYLSGCRSVSFFHSAKQEKDQALKEWLEKENEGLEVEIRWGEWSLGGWLHVFPIVI